MTAPGATTASVTTSLAGRLADTRTGSGSFYPEESTFGATGGGDTFTVDVPARSDVAVTLEWTDATGQSDLDLFVTGTREASSASLDNPEQVALTEVSGTLDVRVDPYFVADPVGGAPYSLTIDVVPLDGPDAFDLVAGVADASVEVQWLEGGEVLATETVTVESDPPDDGGHRDNDTDGDGHSDGKGRAHGTDPEDPDDYPTPGRHG